MDYVERILNKYPWFAETEQGRRDAEEIVEKAKMFYHSIVHKADLTYWEEDDVDTPKKTYWLMLCCDEIVERAGCSSGTSYRENNLQINFDHSQISLGLINMLSPVVGVIKR
jgi:hypothetical protein